MKYALLFSSISVVLTTVMGQNIIGNGSFERYVRSPASSNYKAWFAPIQPVRWTSIIGTVDFYCADTNKLSPEIMNKHFLQSALIDVQGCDSNFYIGLALRYEMVQNELMAPLEKDSLYTFSMFVRFSRKSKFYSNYAGIVLSANNYPRDYHFYRGLKLKINGEMKRLKLHNIRNGQWSRVTFEYKARGGEKYLYITGPSIRRTKYLGSIGTNKNTIRGKSAYFAIDNVSLIKSHIDKDTNDYATSGMDTSFLKDNRLILSGLQFKKNDCLINDSSSYSLDILDSVVHCFENRGDMIFLIEGHTDSSGDSSLNEDLSLCRANAVGNYISALGIPTERIVRRGYGMRRPAYSNLTEEGRSKNRRVEVIIKKGY